MKRLFHLALLSLILLSCTPREAQVQRFSDFALDTTVRFTFYGEGDNRLFEESMTEIRRLEELLSYHREGSEIYELSKQAGGQWVSLSAETQELLKAGIEYAELSSGLLDITAAPLIDLWAIDPPFGHVPTQEELDDVLPLVDYRKLQWDGVQARLPREGMGVNLGALAKGFIADRIKEKLLDQGVTSGIINLGGNILLIGEKPGAKAYRIGVQDPLSTRGEDLGILDIRDASLVSSGDYERFFFDESGNKYHHILNPHKGFPSDNGLMQVTVVSKSSLQGDALSTSLFLLGLKEAYPLVLTLKDVEAVFITEDKQVFITPGLKDSFTFTGNPSGYQVVEYTAQ